MTRHAIWLAIACSIASCKEVPAVDEDKGAWLRDVLVNDLRFVRLPQTGRCYAYAWVRSSHSNASVGGAVVFEVPCDTSGVYDPTASTTLEAPPCAGGTKP